MNRSINIQLLSSLFAVLILQCQGALATEEMENTLGDQTLNIELLDVELLDQDGAPTRFASEVIGDRIVALNFVYTSCDTVCPMVSAIFARLQEQLGDRLGQQVRLASVSIDPLTDTPARLKEYAQRFHAGPDWIWLTGEKQRIESTLKGLGVYTADFSGHAPAVLVGDASRDLWVRFNALASPDEIKAKIDALLAARSITVSQTVE